MDDAGYEKTVQVGIDGSSNSARALAWAIEEGRVRGAKVEAVYVWQVPALAYTAAGFIPPDEESMEREGRRVFDDLLSTAADAGDVKVDLRICEGPPADVLAKVSGDPDVGVLVVGARGHGGFAGLLLGSVSHSLTHHCHKPLVIVPRDWAVGEKGIRGHIVVGVDGSEGSERALRWAVQEARARDIPLEVLMVWSPPSPVLPAHLPITATGSADFGGRVLDVLSDCVARFDTTGVELKLTVLEGSPARILTDRASSAALLVVGTRGLGRTREAVSGSVSHACTHHGVVPVVVVPAAH